MRREIGTVTSTVVLVAATAFGAMANPAESTNETAAQAPVQRTAADEVVVIRDVNDDRIGTVRMTQKDGYVRVRAIPRDIGIGFHGFHVHDVGICDPDAEGGPFATAGGHYVGEEGATHGDHAGDMPSLLVRKNDEAHLTFRTDRFTLAELRRGNGSAVMIHAGRDNFANIPDRYTVEGEPGPDDITLATGDAGARMGCGVID